MNGNGNGNDRPDGRDDQRPDMLGETWDAPDEALDERLRATFGGITPLPTPVYGFERVVMRARRRHQRKVWVAVSCAMAVCVVVTGGVTAGLKIANGEVTPAGCDNAALPLSAPLFPGPAALGSTALSSSTLSSRAQSSRAQSSSTLGSSKPGSASLDLTADRAADLSAPSRVGQGGAAPAAAPAAWYASAVSAAGAADPGTGPVLGREAMNRRSEWAIGGVLTAAALGAGIFAGCSGSNSTNTGTGAPTQSQTSNSPSAGPSAGQSASQGGLSSTTPSTSSTPPPRCHTEDLSPTVTVVAGSQGTGSELINVTLTNNSGHNCTVYGYPGLGLEDQNQLQQASKAVRDAGTKATILVENGASVSTTVKIDFDMPASDEPQTGNCEAPSKYMIVTPPDETTSLEAVIGGGPVTVCEHGQMDELPFIAGATGPNQG